MNSFFEELKNGAVEAAKSVAVGMAKEASADAIAFVSMAAPSIGRYTEMLSSSQITPDEFKSLMGGLLVMAKMQGLTLAQATLIKIDETRNAILKAVTNVALGAVSKIL